ncbi:platelet glycoprotein IX [Tachyglossus aculeatus]|uniref:platelet glycoprotein IX n=1 Tax=Tachyglossus aculeatus TaxID=9261 RepID=UPI0018F6E83F|nr:platelet glycoprotein IX [Tachyglossus aculeatus]
MSISIVEGLALFLLWGSGSTLTCPPSCICQPLETMGLLVDCSHKWLQEVPALPIGTSKLYLQNNSLTTIPPGTFDNMHNLHEVDVSHNPWHCDCGILYLKLWLEDYARDALEQGRCATPATAASLSLSQLTGNELEGCEQLRSIQCHEFLWRDLALIALAVLVVALMTILLWIARRTTYWVTLNQYPYEAQRQLRNSLKHQKTK